MDETKDETTTRTRLSRTRHSTTRSSGTYFSGKAFELVYLASLHTEVRASMIMRWRDRL
ncbi:MAG: hypothetical protein LC749_06095 [Actinobacteria bacterium]|nr:hypothetical protein [Actinomycetota bacterium]